MSSAKDVASKDIAGGREVCFRPNTMPWDTQHQLGPNPRLPEWGYGIRGQY